MPTRRPPPNAPAVEAIATTPNACVAVGVVHSTLGGSGLVHAPVLCGVSLVGQVLEN